MVNPKPQEAEPVLVERRDVSAENTYRRTIFSVPVTVTVPLTTRIEDPIDLTIDDKIIARGELVETENGGLGLKITEIPEEAGAEDA